MSKQILLGNQAFARGAWEAGVRFASAYPGTPSTEITESIALYPEVYSEWSPNEKVAVEVAYGASVAGARALACMKHVGLNVAADPLFTASYTGVNGGLVIIVADDPGMHSSQNEQDSRYYARASHVLMLEPSDAAEAHAMMRQAFELSEEYDTPVLVRAVTRVSHSRGVVMTGERTEVPLRDMAKNISKYVMMPGMARKRHVVVEARDKALAQVSNELAKMEMRSPALGVICAGSVYTYVREALPDASVLKLNCVYPLPEAEIRAFADKVGELVVIEELEPYIEDAVKAMGVACSGKDRTGVQGELSVAKIGALFSGSAARKTASVDIAAPQRPPVLCPGCPHRAVFYLLGKLKMTTFGDIGCYTLGALAPLNAVDTVLCMGASVGMAHGAVKARGEALSKKSVAVIGDSTFLHTGIQPLMNAAYNRSDITLLILDNRTTGMTGHQEHAATGKDIHGQEAPAIDIEVLCRALGVQSVRSVDPFDLKAAETALKEETAKSGPSVIIFKRPCALLVKAHPAAYAIDENTCKNCGMCSRLGCPAIEKQAGHPVINAALCNGCGLCARVCPFTAIKGGDAR